MTRAAAAAAVSISWLLGGHSSRRDLSTITTTLFMIMTLLALSLSLSLTGKDKTSLEINKYYPAVVPSTATTRDQEKDGQFETPVEDEMVFGTISEKIKKEHWALHKKKSLLADTHWPVSSI